LLLDTLQAEQREGCHAGSSVVMATHSTAIELNEPVPAEVAAGTDLVLKIKLTCAAGCDLHSLPLTIKGPDDTDATGAPCLTNDSGEIALKVLPKVGPQSFTISFGSHEATGIRHEFCSLSLTVNSIPHGTSLAVWDIPSPIVKGERFAIKVGAKSAANAELKGLEIAIFDNSETVAARGRLRDTPWPGTTALYWDEVELLAPAEEGLSRWSVRFAPAGLALPHDGTAAEFTAAVVQPPQHRLTVKVIERESKSPIEDVQIRLGAFRGATGPSGLAEVMMPTGHYDLQIWKAGYEAPARPVDIDADLAVEIEAVVLPEEDPDAAWTM
jgi:hypothetical protein